MTDADAVMIWIFLFIAAGLGALIYSALTIRSLIKKNNNTSDKEEGKGDKTFRQRITATLYRLLIIWGLCVIFYLVSK